MNRVVIRLGLVIGVLAALVLAANLLPSGQGPATTALQATRLPLERATFICPESSFAKGSTSTDVAAVAASGQGSLLDAGLRIARGNAKPRLDLTPLGTRTPLASGDRRERLVTYAVRKPKEPPVVVSAQGSIAPGTTAGQITRTGEGPLRGLAESACTSPGSEFWFVGTSSQLGRHGRVYLTNTDNADAQVELRLYDENGPVDADSIHSLAVKARSQAVVELDQLAPTSKRLAVAVVSTRGRVVAALRDDALEGETPVGVDWVPTAARPGRDVVIPGVAPGRGERVLSIVAPGDSTASVDLSVLAAEGSFQPAELGRVDVKPGTVAEVRLDSATQRQAAAIRLTSDVPITATMRSQLGPSTGVRDVAYTAASRSLSGPAVVPVTLGGPDHTATLVLSTPGSRAVRASAELSDADGRSLGSQKLVVKPGRTIAVTLTPSKKVDRYVLVVQPEDGGPLYGARFLVEAAGDGPMMSVWPLASGETTAIRPVTRADLGTGVGTGPTPDALFQ
ncbi:DUF5719 family protein [Actinopolymorpha sp. B9G3]|uniref:DUF5719 family protein n=1 Tax=Actinopolymorpha sp. B9G3 TaxID=3158970 RepID=UPI0032D963F4